jgi:hypothetical protein
MSISKVKINESAERLMTAIQQTVMQHTTQSPMTLEAIIGCLAFTTGAAIGQGKSRGERHQLRNMADSNVDLGIQATSGSQASSIILPEHAV